MLVHLGRGKAGRRTRCERRRSDLANTQRRASYNVIILRLSNFQARVQKVLQEASRGSGLGPYYLLCFFLVCFSPRHPLKYQASKYIERIWLRPLVQFAEYLFSHLL
jgi:hypothetical protein